MKKIKIVSLVLAVVLLAGVSGCKKDKKAESGDNKQTVTEKNGKKEQNKQVSEENKKQEDVKEEMKEAEEEKVYVPTFMYFVSNNDADFAKTNETIE